MHHKLTSKQRYVPGLFLHHSRRQGEYGHEEGIQYGGVWSHYQDGHLSRTAQVTLHLDVLETHSK